MKYTAPDGKEFTDRGEYRQYLFATFYTFEKRKGERLIKKPGDIEGQPFALNELEDCEVLLLDHAEQVTVDLLKNCKVFIGPSCESVFFRDCQDCDVFVACKQLRCRDCHRCNISLFSLSEPVVETSSLIAFSPFGGAYGGLASKFQAANLDPEKNQWSRVFDFNKGDASIPEPHWSIVEQGDWPTWVISDFGEPENPVKGGAVAAKVEDAGLQSFGIDVSQADAARATMDDAAGGNPAVDAAQPAADGFDPFAAASTEAAADPFAVADNAAAAGGGDAPAAEGGLLDMGGGGTAAPEPAAAEAPPPGPAAFGVLGAGEKNKLAEWRAQEGERVRAVDADEREKRAALARSAEEWLENFYRERTDRLTTAKATKREAEGVFLATQEASTASDNPWERVVTMVNIKQEAGEADRGRMRSLLLQIKANPPAHMNK